MRRALPLPLRLTVLALAAGWSGAAFAQDRDAFLAGLTNDCPGCELVEAQLQRRDLTGANLSGANLSGANLIAANLNKTDLIQANFSGATMDRVLMFEADASAINLSGALLRGAFMGSIRLIRANLEGADLTGADLENARISDASLVGAIMLSTDFYQAVLLRAGEARMRGANLTGASFVEAYFYQADLGQTNLTNTDLTGAVLTSAILSDTIQQGTIFTGARMPDNRIFVAPAEPEPPGLEPVVFTPAQVTQGRGLFGSSCTGCHGENLQGLDAPPLTGDFFTHWYDGPVAALFDYIITTMPLDRPGSLTPQQTAALVAFILERNGFAPGETPLPAEPEALARMGFRQ
jgi:uncharacterized protein YjbI with pentapeptide repeats